jgi:hypothetical protein
LASELQVTNGGQNSTPANQMSVIAILRQLFSGFVVRHYNSLGT